MKEAEDNIHENEGGKGMKKQRIIYTGMGRA